MPIPSYLIEKQKLNVSKYHRIQSRADSQQLGIRSKILSRFHSWSSLGQGQIDKTTLDFVRKYDFPLGEVSAYELTEQTQQLVELNSNYALTSFEDRINWTRRRISGLVCSLKIRNGLISEKTFLTAQGNRIIVKRKELGIFSGKGFWGFAF